MTAPDDGAHHALVRRAFDERATTYDDSAMHRALAGAVASFAAAADTRPARRVLDVATGTGLVLRALHERGYGAELTGVDLSPGMLAEARRLLPEATFMEGLAERMPVAEASADLITCVTALHVMPNPSAVIAEWARVLQPHGSVITATFMADGLPTHTTGGADYRRDHRPFAGRSSLAATVAPAGFVVTRTEQWLHEGERVLIAELSRPSAPRAP